MAYLYRRANGTFYARIRVPEALRPTLGGSDLRRSLKTSDHRVATRLALELALGWKQDFLRLEAMLDANKLAAGSPVLLTGGQITIAEAAHASGLRPQTFLREAIADSLSLYVAADGWFGAEMSANDLIRDVGSDEAKVFVLDVGETLYGRELVPIFGQLRTRPEAHLCIRDEIFSDCLFFSDARGKRAVVAPLPGVEVPIGNLQISKPDAESIRARLASRLTPAMLESIPPASAVPATPAAAFSTPSAADWKGLIAEAVQKASMGPAYAQKGTRVSAMLDAFYASKSWAPATEEQNKRMCGLFVQIMQNPMVGEIDRNMISTYRARLMRLPSDLRNVKARNRGKTLDELAEMAVANGWATTKPDRADRYVMKIGEAFEWAVKNEYMSRNPAANAVVKTKTTQRAQDKRMPFATETLARIFGTAWYQNGKGSKTAAGKFHHYQPFNYWLPLLGLFTGARINELSQLHLKDVKKTADGTWYLDFNLEGAEKLDADGAEDRAAVAEQGGEKRLKTLNAVRIIPVHRRLVELGLSGYVDALRTAGHERLFPELRFDRLKGFGKYASQWFNERFLGRQLKIARDSTQTFHSFRHTFLTACDREEMPDRVRNEIAGHGRGEGQGHVTYIKDRDADELAPYLSGIDFQLPPIARFDIDAGLEALQDALKRKERVAKQKARATGG